MCYLHFYVLILKILIFIHFSINIWEFAAWSPWTQEKELIGKIITDQK